MIRVSRFLPRTQRGGLRVHGEKLRGRPRGAGWHVPCFTLVCSGCLYIGPITLLEDENVPPEIMSHTDGLVYCPDDGYAEGEMCIVNQQQLVFLTAMDENDDALEFYWWGTGSGPIENAVTSSSGEFQTSNIRLSPADVIDGEELKCSVSDGSSDTKTQTWTLVVFQ